MAFDPQAESIFSSVFGRAPETPEERSFLGGVAARKSGSALAGALQFQQQGGGAPASLSPAPTNPQSQEQQADPVESGFEAAKKAIIDAQQRIQKANMNIFKKELQLDLQKNLLSSPALKELLSAESSTNKSIAETNTSVQGSEIARPTQLGSLLGQDLQNKIQTSGDIGRAFALRGQGISQIISDIAKQREQAVSSAQVEQQGATSALNSLININQEQRAQELQPLEIKTRQLQQQKLTVDINNALLDGKEKQIALANQEKMQRLAQLKQEMDLSTDELQQEKLRQEIKKLSTEISSTGIESLPTDVKEVRQWAKLYGKQLDKYEGTVQQKVHQAILNGDTAEAGKELQLLKINADSGLRALQTVKSKLIREDGTVDNSALARAKTLGGIFGGRTTLKALKEVADVYTRLRTGAALNEQEIAFYDSQLPTLLDVGDAESVKTSLEMFEQLFLSISGQSSGDEFIE